MESRFFEKNNPSKILLLVASLAVAYTLTEIANVQEQTPGESENSVENTQEQPLRELPPAKEMIARHNLAATLELLLMREVEGQAIIRIESPIDAALVGVEEEKGVYSLELLRDSESSIQVCTFNEATGDESDIGQSPLVVETFGTIELGTDKFEVVAITSVNTNESCSDFFVLLISTEELEKSEHSRSYSGVGGKYA